jgi:two-component system LytT family response regulator
VIKLLAELKKPSKIARRFAIRLGERIFVVKPDEIGWIQGAGNYSELHVGSAVHLLRGTLAELEEQLSPTRFIRISRSHIVNVDRIQEIRAKSHGDYVVVLRDGKELVATRNHREKLVRWLDGTI